MKQQGYVVHYICCWLDKWVGVNTLNNNITRCDLSAQLTVKTVGILTALFFLEMCCSHCLYPCLSSISKQCWCISDSASLSNAKKKLKSFVNLSGKVYQGGYFGRAFFMVSFSVFLVPTHWKPHWWLFHATPSPPCHPDSDFCLCVSVNQAHCQLHTIAL